MMSLMSTIYVSVSKYGDTTTIKAVSDKDCIPSDVVKIVEFVSSADMENRVDRSERFWHFYDKMRWIEMLGFTVCIDFGDYFYESGMMAPEIKDNI